MQVLVVVGFIVDIFTIFCSFLSCSIRDLKTHEMNLIRTLKFLLRK